MIKQRSLSMDSYVPVGISSYLLLWAPEVAAAPSRYLRTCLCYPAAAKDWPGLLLTPPDVANDPVTDLVIRQGVVQALIDTEGK